MPAPSSLVLFGLPKAFRGHVGTIQRNAIESWRRLGVASQILLFGDEVGTADVAAEYGCRHVPVVRRNARGTPLVDDVFRIAERLAPRPLLCYVNADTMLLPDFGDAVKSLGVVREPLLVIGRRWDLTVEERLDFARGWDAELRRRLTRVGQLHDPAAVDYFVFSRGLWPEVPPFALGRTAWDNWLVFAARRRGARVVDATASVTCVHQTHDYSHVPGGWTEVWRGPEAQKNLELAGGGAQLYTVHDATDILRGGRLWPALTPAHLRRRWRHVRRRNARVVAVRIAFNRWPGLRRWALPAA